MSSRSLKIALAASVTLNVFVLGAVFGAVGARVRIDPQRPPAAGNPLMRAGDHLEPAHREAFRARLRAEGQASRPVFEEGRSARREAAQIFAQQQFDPQAASAALARARQAEFTARERLDAAVIDFAAGLPQEQRRLLAEGLRQPPRGGRGRRGGGERHGPPEAAR